MKILVTGATGFVGEILATALQSNGNQLTILSTHPARATRKLPKAQVISWNGMDVPPNALEKVEAVIHLAGESIATRWNAKQKERIHNSRVLSMQSLLREIERQKIPLRSFISASAIGFYGDRSGEVLTEGSLPGSGFLAQVCQDWEKPLWDADLGDAQTIALRIGIVLGAGGGVLKKLLLPFKLGLGGPIGTGLQWMTWIHREDLVKIFLHALKTPHLDGPVNAVSPNPVTNEDFSKTLAKVLHRPAALRMPTKAIRLMMGEMAELVLSSQRVSPQKLLASGFKFQFPELEDALKEAK